MSVVLKFAPGLTVAESQEELQREPGEDKGSGGTNLWGGIRKPGEGGG